MGRWVVWGLAFTLILPLSGCLGADDVPEVEPEDAPPEASADAEAGTAGLEGRLVDESLDPIAGGNVRLAQAATLIAETLTDARGEYAFSDLEPGEYVVQASAICCREKVSRVILEAGEVTKYNAILPSLPSIAPHVEEDEWHGLIGCSVRIPGVGGLNVGACGNLDPNHDYAHEFRIEPGLENVVFALVWEPVVTNAPGDLAVRMYKGNCCGNGNTFFRLDGTSPLEIVYGPGGARGGEPLNFSAMEEPWDVRYQVWGGGDASLVYQQPFSIYWHLYYVEPAPEGASAIPD